MLPAPAVERPPEPFPFPGSPLHQVIMIDLAADAAAHFGDFEESIVYRPRVGSTRNIVAIVDRSPPAPLGPPGTLAAQLTVAVMNSAVVGISAGELDTGGDSIDVALRVGGTPETRRITRIAEQDAGMLVLEVR